MYPVTIFQFYKTLRNFLIFKTFIKIYGDNSVNFKTFLVGTKKAKQIIKKIKEILF